VALIERYLAGHRPVLAAAGNRALFPGRGLGSKGRAALGKQISGAVFRETGLKVHPHLFRHIAGKLYLGANPGAIEVVRRVLGHRSVETTLGYYTGAETAAAVRHFDATLLKLREGSGETSHGRRRVHKGKKQ
jgi:integrase